MFSKFTIFKGGGGVGGGWQVKFKSNSQNDLTDNNENTPDTWHLTKKVENELPYQNNRNSKTLKNLVQD